MKDKGLLAIYGIYNWKNKINAINRRMDYDDG